MSSPLQSVFAGLLHLLIGFLLFAALFVLAVMFAFTPPNTPTFCADFSGYAALLAMAASLTLAIALWMRGNRRFMWRGLALAGVAGGGVFALTLPALCRNHDVEINPVDPDMWRYRPFDVDHQLATLDAPSTLTLAAEGLPRLDGATALYPL